MFKNLQTEVMDRFSAVEAYFRATYRMRGDATCAATSKGIAFVQVYAAYEFTVCSVMRIAIDRVNAHGHRYSDLSTSMLALFLHPDLQSLRDCPDKKVWERRLTLFKAAASRRKAKVANDVLPSDGSHFRSSHLQILFRVLGIRRVPAARRTHLFRIDEVVENRNAIAHGRETADQVGRRYSRSDVRRAIRQVKSACLKLIAAIEQHCDSPDKHRR